MPHRPPIQLWQHLATALLCGLTVVVSVRISGSLGELVTVGCWLIGHLLLSVGGISLTGTPRLSTSVTAIATNLLYCLPTIPLLPSAGYLPAILLATFQLLVLSVNAVRAGWSPPQQASQTHIAIKVTSEPPTSNPSSSERKQQSEATDEKENSEIDASLEQALLSKLSASSMLDSEDASESDDDSEIDRTDQSQAIQFQTAEKEIAQRYERGSAPDGREWLEGTIRVDFLRNQKTAVIHIPFWPAFQTRPDVNSELLDGPHLKIDVKTVERWGVRLELTRRAAGLDPDSAELAFFVTTQSAARGAA